MSGVSRVDGPDGIGAYRGKGVNVIRDDNIKTITGDESETSRCGKINQDRRWQCGNILRMLTNMTAHHRGVGCAGSA